MIEEQNKLIGDFAGIKADYDEHGVWQPLQFHCNFQKLMEAWFKFRDLENIKHETTFVNFKYKISYALCYQTIEQAFGELVRAIEWYNTIKQ